MAEIDIGTEEINKELEKIAKSFERVSEKSKSFSKKLKKDSVDIASVVEKIGKLPLVEDIKSLDKCFCGSLPKIFDNVVINCVRKGITLKKIV